MVKSDKTNRHLGPSDREIWSRITRTAVPLDEKDKNFNSLFAEMENVRGFASPSAISLQNLKTTTTTLYQPRPQKKPVLNAGNMDKNTTRKISRGRIVVDGRIDLHGHSQQEAYQLLFTYVENAWYGGKKILLVITGKGNLGRGVLRENVPKWLASAPFLPLVSEFGASHDNHGGNGALYVRIRKNPNINTKGFQA